MTEPDGPTRRPSVWYGFGPLALVVLGLWFLNLAAFDWWLSWGPPTPNPRVDLVWAGFFLVAACAMFIGAYILRRSLARR